MDCDFTRISDDWDVDVANGPLEDGRKSKGRQKRDEMLFQCLVQLLLQHKWQEGLNLYCISDFYYLFCR